MISKEHISHLLTRLTQITSASNILNTNYALHEFKKNPPFYLFYPYLFIGDFGLKREEKLDNLSVGGFLQYLNLIIADKLIDQEEKYSSIGYSEQILTIQELLEQSTKILTSIFPNGSKFWKHWNQRKKEYKNIYVLENTMKNGNFEMGDYENLSKGKVAFAAAAIDACHVLTDGEYEVSYNALISSHNAFSVGLQISDDITDYKKDYKSDSFNLALHEINKANIKVDDFLRSPIVNNLYELSLDYFKKAKDSAKNTKSHWSNIIDYKIKEIKIKYSEVDAYNKINKYYSGLSTITSNNNDIDSAISKAIDFIVDHFEGDHWIEYKTQAGYSTTWATGFISLFLDPLKEVDKRITNCIDRASEYMAAQDSWGFNQNWGVSDADTTNFALFNINSSDKVCFDKLLKYQTEDGGISTYNEDSNIKEAFGAELFNSYNGWYSSHTCVSAVSAHLFYEHRDKYPLEYKKLVYYLKSTQNNSSIWDSYWWTSPIYATYFAYNFFKKTDVHNQCLIEIRSTLKNLRDSEGTFSDPFGVNLFYSGLANNILLDDQSSNKTSNLFVEYLTNNQYSDGSWANHNSLQIPNPGTITPSAASYPKVKPYGLDVRAIEFQRLFTTVVCLNTLFSAKNGKDVTLRSNNHTN